jgi:hypothetical protein
MNLEESKVLMNIERWQYYCNITFSPNMTEDTQKRYIILLLGGGFTWACLFKMGIRQKINLN